MTSLRVHSNLGGNTINEVALDFWRAGRAREEISMELLEQRLRLELQEAAGKSWARSWGALGSCLQSCPSAPSHPVCHTGLCMRERALTPPQPGLVDKESPILGPCEPRHVGREPRVLLAPFSPWSGARGSPAPQGSTEASLGLQASLGVIPRDALCSGSVLSSSAQVGSTTAG